MIGALRNKLELLSASRAPDTGGGFEVTWQVTTEIWASINQLTPIRDVTGERRTFLKRLAAEVRSIPGLMAGSRVRFNTDDYEVVSVETLDERQRRLVLICEEVPTL